MTENWQWQILQIGWFIFWNSTLRLAKHSIFSDHLLTITIAIWRFPKSWEYPQIMHFNVILRSKHCKPSIFGYPDFWNPPCKHRQTSNHPISKSQKKVKLMPHLSPSPCEVLSAAASRISAICPWSLWGWKQLDHMLLTSLSPLGTKKEQYVKAKQKRV